jgi:hypothetical protein
MAEEERILDMVMRDIDEMLTSPCVQCSSPVEHDGIDAEKVLCMRCAYSTLEEEEEEEGFWRW